MISTFGAVFLHEWHSLKIRGNFFSRGPPPLTPPCFEKIDPPLAEKKVDPLPWAEGACPPMWTMPTHTCTSEVGQYQIVVQYQYQYFLKFHFQYQDQYQYCPWKTIKININIKTNIFSKRNIKIKINILKNLNSISIPASISSIYWYWYWKSIFHWAMLTALDFLLHLAVISD